MYNGFLDYGGGDDPVDNQKNAEGFVKSAFFFGYFLTQVQMVTLSVNDEGFHLLHFPMD